MTTCPHITHKTRRIHDGFGGLVRWKEPCGLPLDIHGLCSFHDGPMCSVCGWPMPTAAEQRTHRYTCSIMGPHKPVVLSAEGHNALLDSLEREKNRCGGWQGMRDERAMQEAERRERR